MSGIIVNGRSYSVKEGLALQVIRRWVDACGGVSISVRCVSQTTGAVSLVYVRSALMSNLLHDELVFLVTFF